MPIYLKTSLFLIAISFLAYSIYWTAYSVFWIYHLTININTWFAAGTTLFGGGDTLEFGVLLVQEYGASVGYFLALIGSVFAIQSIVLFTKNDEKYRDRLGKAFLFEALFFILLIPSGIHHLLGVVLSWTYVDMYVGLSFLLQALLIVPPFLILSHNLRKPQKHASILKWIAIAALLFVFGFWLKYLFLWLDALLPLGPKQATLMSTVGAANAMLTLLVAGILTAVACYTFYQKKKMNKCLVGTALILFGSYFIIYDLVSIWVPVYSSFLYLTDFWMITLPILGIAIIKLRSKTKKAITQ